VARLYTPSIDASPAILVSRGRNVLYDYIDPNFFKIVIKLPAELMRTVQPYGGPQVTTFPNQVTSQPLHNDSTTTPQPLHSPQLYSAKKLKLRRVLQTLCGAFERCSRVRL